MIKYLVNGMVLAPFLGAILQAIYAKGARAITLLSSILGSLIGLFLVAHLHGMGGSEIGISVPWIESFAISYHLTVDGLNSPFVVLISIVFPLLVGYEWKRAEGSRGFHGLLLIMQTATIGAVCSQDLFLMFFFWALSAAPLYFLIGIWGDKSREEVATRTMVVTSIGNALIFAALVLVYFASEPHTFAFEALAAQDLGAKVIGIFGHSFSVSHLSFSLIVLGMGLRIPVWPLHKWFTDLTKASPPSVFVATGSVLVTVAIFLFVKISLLLFPGVFESSSTGLMIVGLVNLLLGGILAVSQRNLKSMLGYFYLSEVGFVLISLSSHSTAGMVGSFYELMCMGLALTGLGLLIGLIDERVGSAEFLDQDRKSVFGGFVHHAPAMAVVFGLVVASFLGVPGLGGFVGRSLMVIGSFGLSPVLLLAIGFALILSTYYLFNTFGQVFLGTFHLGTKPNFELSDLSWRERACLFPVVIFLVLMGLYPAPLISLIRPAVERLLKV